MIHLFLRKQINHRVRNELTAFFNYDIITVFNLKTVGGNSEIQLSLSKFLRGHFTAYKFQNVMNDNKIHFFIFRSITNITHLFISQECLYLGMCLF